MSDEIFDISMSLDGFITAAKRRPMGTAENGCTSGRSSAASLTMRS